MTISGKDQTWAIYENTLKCQMDLDHPVKIDGIEDDSQTQERIKDFQQCFFNTQMANMSSLNAQGSSPIYTNEMLIEDLTKFNQNLRNEKISNALKALDNMRRALLTEFLNKNEIGLLKGKSKEEINLKKAELTAILKDAKEAVAKKVRELSPNETTCVPIGCSNHFMFMEITCKAIEGEKKYTFRIYNSRYEYSHRAFSCLDYLNPWSRIPTLQIANVNEGICGSEFFSKLYDAAFFSKYDGYDLFTEYLVKGHGGRILPPEPNRGHHPQGKFSFSCVAKTENFWLKETIGKDTYSQFKTARMEYSIERLRKLKLQKSNSWAERNLSLFVCRILYFLFNYMTINATIQLGEQMLAKRLKKHPRSLLVPI